MSTTVPGWKLAAPTLQFSAAIPGRVATQPFTGVAKFGPYDNSALELGDGALLFMFPKAERALAHKLAKALLNGVGTFGGFEKFFRVPVAKGEALRHREVDTDLADLAAAAEAYRTAITGWNAERNDRMPAAAIVLVPRSERFETATPYYEAKAAFANLAIPTQMVTIDLVKGSQFNWAVANIALALFAKLGGIPWTVRAPATDKDLILGIGRADIGPNRDRYFGYAVTFVNNGIYRHTHSFTPASTEDAYLERLTTAVRTALSADLDQPVERLVIHLAKEAGRREIDAAQRAIDSLGLELPVAFLRLDDSSLHDIADADAQNETFAPPKGLVAKLGPRRALLQTDELGPTGAPDGPLLVSIDRRSSVPVESFDDLLEQVFRLSAANWRGFNARSKPATLVYGEQLAQLVGHLSDLDTWQPDLLRPELTDRPWFL